MGDGDGGGDGDGAALFHQLDSLLSWDPLIDEVDFVHPSQLASLREQGSSVDLPTAVDQSAFWCEHHKLAISASNLGSLYRAAKSAFLITSKEYEALLMDPKRAHNNRDLVKKLLSYTRSVIVLNSSYKTAWDTRKKIFSNALSDVPLTELRLSSLALSFNPKCEDAWAHRRWVINNHIQQLLSRQIPEDLLQGEFKLVEMVAERSRMNYRAWCYCCWLVPLMSLPQVLHGLQKWKRWAELHVADNSCFHFRQCLFQRLFADEEAASVWQDEIEWNNKLIKSYIGRESLWMHRRFLFFIRNKCLNHDDNILSDQKYVEREMEFTDKCIASCSSDGDEDDERQISYAASYKLWILLISADNWTSHLRKQELYRAQQLLGKFAAHHKQLWDGLFQNL